MGSADPVAASDIRPGQSAAPSTAVVGLGLIGGSILRGLAAAGATATGWDADPGVRGAARAAGLAVPETVEQALAEPELIVVAVPPLAAVKAAVDALARAPRASVCDVCSVKGPVLDGVASAAGDAAERFVGGHPLAGSEHGGFQASRETLFAGATWALCPGQGALDCVLVACRLVEALGARSVMTSAQRHDEAVARSSHLPHLLAGLLARGAAGQPAAALSGGALRDATRVAGADPALWSEILLVNAGAVGPALRDAQSTLNTLAGALEERDGRSLREALDAGVAAREAILRDRWVPQDWEAREVDLSGWRRALVELGDQGLAIRRLSFAGERLRFEVARRAAGAPGEPQGAG